MASFLKNFYKLAHICLILILVFPAVALLAFGPRGIDQPPQGRVIVDYWEKWNGEEERALRLIINDFNTTVGAKESIFVRCLSTSEVTPKTLIATAAGVPPDVAGLFNTDVAQFGARDALLPLDDLAAEHGITAARYKKVFWDQCHYEGKLYALISTCSDVALYYNTAKFRAAGLAPNKPPTSIAEFTEAARRLDSFDRSGNLVTAGYIPIEPDFVIDYTAFWFGGDWWDEQKQRFCFTDPKVIEAYRWVQSFPKHLGAKAMATFRSGLGNLDSPQNAFFAQTIAMEQNGTYFSRFIHQRAPDLAGKWSVAPFPSNDPTLKDVTYCGSDVLTIPRGARHPREAFEFIAYMNRQDVLEKLANLHGKISPLVDVTPGFLAHHSNPFIRIFDRLAASANARSTPAIPDWPEVKEEMQNFIERLNALKVTPEEGLQQVQVSAQKKYDAFMEELRLRNQEKGSQP